MSTPANLNPAQRLTPPRPAGRPAQPPVKARAPGDQMGIALPPGEGVRAWFDNAQRAIPTAKPAQLREMLARGEALLARPNLDALAQARVHLVMSGAAGQLAALEVSQISNAKLAFRHVARAFALAPFYDQAATAYGRTIAAFCDVNWAKRKVVELGVGISIGDEAARGARALGAFPQDAVSQLTRRKLAAFAEDKAELAAADAAIAALPAARVAAARRELQLDQGYAAQAKQVKP